MERAFGTLDERVRRLEALAQTQSGEEKTATEQQIADLKRRRELHWTRAQTALVESQPVQRAEPIAERVIKAERVSSAQRTRQAERARLQRMPREAPRYASPNFFERLFR